MNTYDIWHNGVKYPAADITIFACTPDELCVTVSTTDLQDALMQDIRNGIGAYEAIVRDEDVCYYLTPGEIAMSEKNIVALVESSYK